MKKLLPLLCLAVLAACQGNYNISPLGGSIRSNGWNGRGGNLLESAACLMGSDTGFISPQGVVVNRKALDPKCSPEYGYSHSVGLYMVDPDVPAEIRARQGEFLGSGAFDREGYALIKPALKNTAGKCFFLKAANGAMIPVRGGLSGDKYLFTSPLLTQKMKAAYVQGAADSAQQRVNSLRAEQSRARSNLDNNPSFRNGRCVAVEAQTASLPPRPAVPSDSTIREQAMGSCMSSARALYGDDRTDRAYRAAGRAGTVQAANAYIGMEESQKLDCARNAIRQERAAPTSPTAIGAAFEEMGNLALHATPAERTIYTCNQMTGPRCYQAIRNDVDQCVNEAVALCRAPLEAWEFTRRRILNEPEKLQAACRQDMATLERTNDEAIARAEAEANLNAQEAGRINGSVASSGQVSLSSASCP